MKHTTTRKKMLLSSVAMLLVAMLALGSATFAWFASNPNAKASGLTLKTTASTGLVIRTDTDYAWSHDAKLYKNVADPFNLTPVSQKQGAGNTAADFYTTDAILSSAYKAFEPDSVTDEGTIHLSDIKMQKVSAGGPSSQANETTNATMNSNNILYKENVYFRLSDGSNPADATTKSVYLTGVTITPTLTADGQTNPTGMQNAIRVAIADKAGKLLGTYSLDANGNGTLVGSGAPVGGKYDAAVEDFNPPITQTGNTNEKIYTGNLDVKDLLGDFVSVYVYLDGQHSNCYSDNVKTINAQKFINSIELNFTLDTDPAKTPSQG